MRITELQAQLAERDKTILDQQLLIKNLASALDGYFTTEDFRQEVKDACGGLEAALKAERIKTLDDAAIHFEKAATGKNYITTLISAELRRMANELKK